MYKSSAGSGKTFTLVKEYLRLALADPAKLQFNFKRILALTFTNKAAAEMKSRVIEALQQLAEAHPDSKLTNLLCADLGITAAELEQRAKIVLSQILHHYSDFAIGTIDSFTHKLVKTFAHDLKLPVNFNLELDISGFYEKVVADLFSQIGEDPYVSKLLKEYVLIKAEDNASWDPESLILSFSQLLQKENSEEYIAVLRQLDHEQLESVRKQVIGIRNDYFKFISSEAQKAIQLIQQHGLSDADFRNKSGGAQTLFIKARDKKAGLEEVNAARVTEALEKNRWLDEKQNISGSDTLNEKFSHIAGIIKNYIIQNYTLFSLCRLIDKQIYPLLLLKKIEEISLNKKEEERLVFITEFNAKIFEIITNEPTPFIYERLGEKYRHFLLDEFQDTSSLQWHNILPLIDNSLSNGWYNLLVGDGKQSIYRWRNANVQQFANLPQVSYAKSNTIVEERANNLKRNFKAEVLNFNYRSLKNIVTFNNSVFAYLSAKLLSNSHLNIYAEHQQQLVQQDGGYISIHYGKLESGTMEVHNFELIRKHIHSALTSSFAYRDICILCRNNKQGNAVAHFLMEENIPVLSSESLLIKHNTEVNVLLAFLNYLIQPDDKIAAAVVLNYLFQSKKINEQQFHIFLSRLTDNTSLFTLLSECGITLKQDDFLLNNLFDNCILLITALQLNHTGHFYLRFFLDEVNEFLVKENSNLPAFLQWWERRSKKASLIIPEGTNAVQVMTIHSSKGLEFPVVILPFCNWQVYRASDDWVNVQNEKINLPVAVVNLNEQAAKSGLSEEVAHEKQEQMLDNLNLLYVGFTRAVERLHLITYTGARSTNTVSEWMSTYLKENGRSDKVGEYCLGELTPKSAKEKLTKMAHFDLLPLNFDTTQGTIAIKAAYLHSSEEAEDAKQHGLLLHWLLSQITTSTDVQSALEKGRLQGYFSSEESRALETQVTALMNDPKLKAYFLPGLHCKIEAELVTHNGEVLRPDRIIFYPEETVLIDYKTGKENNKKYGHQLDKYQQALNSMSTKKIRKLLVYVDNLTVVELN